MAREEYLEKLRRYKESHAEKYGIEAIGIFGSIARGEEKSDSDVDICIKMNRPDLYYLVHIKEDLQNIFGRPVDVVRLRPRMSALLRKNIERDTIYA